MTLFEAIASNPIGSVCAFGIGVLFIVLHRLIPSFEVRTGGE